MATSAWRRSPTSAMSLTTRSATSPKASRAAVGSARTNRWPAGSSRWRGSGRLQGITPGPWPPLTKRSVSRRARLLLAQGDLAAVAQWATSSGLSVDDKASYLREQEHLVLVRLLLARAEPDPALALLGRLHEAAACQERTGSLIQVLALRALALAAAGSPGQAVEALREALTLARPQGYVRVFADEGAVMASLLARVDGVPADYVARV